MSGGQTTLKTGLVMPKLSERERLAELEARQRRVAQEVETARRALRGKYADIVRDLPIEVMSERIFKNLLTEAWIGVPASRST